MLVLSIRISYVAFCFVVGVLILLLGKVVVLVILEEEIQGIPM